MSEANVLGILCDFALSVNKIPIRAKVSFSHLTAYSTVLSRYGTDQREIQTQNVQAT